MDELAQILASGETGSEQEPSALKPDTTSPTGFRNSRGQFVKADDDNGREPMANDALVRALAGSGSPEELDQMRQYQKMLQQRPSFQPRQPQITGSDIGGAVTGNPDPTRATQPTLGGSGQGADPSMGQAGMGGQMPGMGMQGQPGMMRGIGQQPPMRPEDQQTLMDRIRQMGPGLQQLYGPRQ